jgi:hypothetical protein
MKKIIILIIKSIIFLSLILLAWIAIHFIAYVFVIPGPISEEVANSIPISPLSILFRYYYFISAFIGSTLLFLFSLRISNIDKNEEKQKSKKFDIAWNFVKWILLLIFFITVFSATDTVFQVDYL